MQFAGVWWVVTAVVVKETMFGSSLTYALAGVEIASMEMTQ